MLRPRKVILIFLVVVLISGIFYWIFKIDIKDYFISKNVIYWTENIEIKYSDFEADINPNSENDIYYYHAFYMKANDVQSAYARSFFDKKKSWAKDTTNYDFATENKLQQIRFDIYEVYARKFNKRIKELQRKESTKYEDLTKVGDSLYREVNKEIDKLFNSDLSAYERIKIWRPKVDQRLIQNSK